jgi:hypothetical protein
MRSRYGGRQFDIGEKIASRKAVAPSGNGLHLSARSNGRKTQIRRLGPAQAGHLLVDLIRVQLRCFGHVAAQSSACHLLPGSFCMGKDFRLPSKA